MEGSDAERQSIVDNTEDEWRLPNLASAVPPDQMHPVVAAVLQHKLPRVTIYRAVPKGVTVIRPGDWVALSKSYAENHRRGEDGAVLSMRVPVEDVAWAGTDKNEYYYAPKPHDD